MGAIGLLFAVLAHPLGAEVPSSQGGSGTWVVRSEPHIDLWYHALAVVGVEGLGALPMYESGYPARIRMAKEAKGVYPTPLDRIAGRVRSAVQRDPAFEVLHFLPVYFAGSGRLEMMEALQAVAVQRSGVPSIGASRARFGATAVASVLTSPEQRAILGELVQALGQEWDLFYGEYWQGQLEEGRGSVGALQDRWSRDFLPSLDPFLRRVSLDGGVLLLSPPVGPEGRVFAGDPGNRHDNVVVVGIASEDSGADEPLFAAVREICFPAVRRALDRVELEFSSRAQGDETSSWAAVRCGEALLERYLPERLSSYRESALRLRGNEWEGRGEAEDALRAAFPIDLQLERALIEEINRT